MRSGRTFLRRRDIERLEARFERCRERLRRDVRDDPAVRSATEWLLDNYYLVRRVLGQLSEELPAGFQKRLPTAGVGGEPRLLDVALLIYDGKRDLDLEGIESFLGSYQELAPLTIAELWALPALLRLVILRRFLDLLESLEQVSARQEVSPSSAGAGAGRAIRALRLLAEIDWKEVFSRQSATERILREDPTRAYQAMDFDSRDSYRRAVEEIAWPAGLDEITVSRAALDRALGAAPDTRHGHVGHWLFGPGRRALEQALGGRRRSSERLVLEHPHLAFFGLLAWIQLALLGPVGAFTILPGAPPSLVLLALLLCWFPASVPTTALTHWLLSKLLRPRPLHKLDFSAGIPARWRTLVAVPTLLGDPDEIDRLTAELEVRYLANPDPELRFALLTGYMDSDALPGPQEQARLARVAQGVRRLNERYARAGSGPFHLLHRESRYNDAEGKWMGWERKRGILEELNRYLRGALDTSFSTHVGDPDGLLDVVFVLTLDTDTELPPGAAARLVGALAHPLNRPRVDSRGLVREGYTVIQPRVEISPRSARCSPFTKLFSGDTGIDIYTRAVSEVYQDVFGEGIYVGKGLYDLDEFQRCLEGRVPENTLLSHDLFEGVHGRGALATDIVVYEDYPVHYTAYLHRLHRWVRGDWQLLPWLFPRVPKAGGGTLPNQLGFVDRFKILDNLRRSLLSPALMALLVSGWLVLPGHPLFWTLAAILAPGAAAVWTMVRTGGLPRQELGRWLLALCFAPQEARTVLDAVGRTLGRMLWSHRHLLEWVTAARATRLLGDAGRASYYRQLWVGPVTSVTLALVLTAVSPTVLPWAAPWLLLWFFSPEIALRVGRPRRREEQELAEVDVRQLRLVARRTWSFFETFVGPGDHWLPPDHFQEHPLGVSAHRTSPTNIAMLLLSQLAAYDLGYVAARELSSWVSSTLETLDKLEQHHGHLYNWYDTRTLEPLEPRYVSTVDSGNLAGALLTLAVGLERVGSDPPLRHALTDGLRDTALLLVDALDGWAVANEHPATAAATELGRAVVEELPRERTLDASLIEVLSVRVRAVEEAVLAALRSGLDVSQDTSSLGELRLWLDRLDHQLREVRREASSLPGSTPGDAVGPTEAARTRLRVLARRARDLALAMDFRFLYDGERRLLRVGYNVSASRFDTHHYDLLASEARLASYLAIATQQVPTEHWYALGRPLTRAGRRGRALLSWGGSMFEYLMPRLLMESHEDTLLQQSCEAAVDRQIAYGSARGVPWGISESGYAFLDQQEAYQYRSFGVPGLGLRRGLEDDLVIAPYASVLALPFRPREVMENLERLERLSMLGRFGFYEALDFSAERRIADRPARVRSYMAHHQGMALVAIDNRLNADVMVARFHGEPRLRSWSLLLDERVPVEIRLEAPVIDSSRTGDVASTPHVPLSGWQPDRSSGAVWAIGNGALTALVGADGGGSLRAGKLAVTRGYSALARDRWGSWVHLRDEDTGELFGVTPSPFDVWPADAQVTFDASAVEFRRRQGDLLIRTRIAVASDEAVEVREVEIENHGDVARRIMVLGAIEPVLEPARDAARHPAFSRLFLRCRGAEELSGVLVMRAARDATPIPALLFRVVADAECRPRLFEIDRREFFGRRGSPHMPHALTSRHEVPALATLDPLCACAAELELPPGTRRSVAFVTVLAPTPAEALGLGRRYSSTHAIHWTFEDAAQAAARRIVRLSLAPRLLPVAQRVLSGLLSPDRRLRAPEAVLAVGRPAQHQLWGRGISGDEPLALVRLHDSGSSELLDELLAVHRYLRELGIRFDIVVIDATQGGYVDDGPEHLQRALARAGASMLLHQRGGVHCVRAQQAGPQELADLEASALVHLDDRDGRLEEQLAKRPREPAELPRFEPAGVPPGAPPDPELDLPVPELDFDNGLGGFDGDDYLVRPNTRTPAPWCNVLANDRLGCLVSEAGLGCTWSLNAGENRLTPWHNDPVLDPPSEVLYVRDEETARVWSTTPEPLGLPTVVRHGHGFTSYESVCAGLEQTMTVFVPPSDPVKIVRLRLKNRSARPRRLTATYYAEWVLGNRRSETAPFVVPDVSVGDACLLAECAWAADFAGRVAFLASDRPLHGWTCDRLELLGPEGDPARPAGLRRWGLSGRAVPASDPSAALQVHLDLGPGESVDVCFFLGQTESRERTLDLVRRLRAAGAADEAFRACQSFWQGFLGGVRVQTPDPALDRLCNGWLPYQAMASRYLGRTAFYQPGGAFGFRDQLQDVLAFLHFDPSLVRGHLIEAAAHQFTEGDVLHWWHPPGDAGVRTRCSDDLLWLVYSTAEYVRATGDVDVLAERVPFLTGEPLKAGDHSEYGRFRPGEQASLLEHCRRAWTRGFTAGRHGLPLMGDGDWNDGMDRVGSGGRGESVWLGWFVHECTERFAWMLERAGEATEAQHCRARLPALRAALSEHGWDGTWYKRAYFDDGTALGSAHSSPPHIDSIAQSWAALSGAAEPERVEQALRAVNHALVREQERLVLLLAPPFGGAPPNPGYIAAYPAGIRENGGQYTHAAAWLGWAYVAVGDGEAAHRIFGLLNPLERTRSPEDVERYRVEPYVIAADVYGRPPFVGRGGWTWYTGAAAWTYRLAVEGILGLRLVDGELEVSPCLPPDWPGFEARLRRGGLVVRVIVHNEGSAGVPRVQLDGVPQERARVALEGIGERTLELWLARSEVVFNALSSKG